MTPSKSNISPRLAALKTLPFVALRLPVVVCRRDSNAVQVGLLSAPEDDQDIPSIEVDGVCIHPDTVSWVDGPQEAREFAEKAYPVLPEQFFSDLIGLVQHQMRVRGGYNSAGATSEKKARSSARNGALGGRPRKKDRMSEVLGTLIPKKGNHEEKTKKNRGPHHGDTG